MIFSYKRLKVSLFLFSWNRYKHQMIFFGFQLAQGKQLRAAYVISRSYGHPDFLSRLKFLLGDHSFFYPPAHLSDLGFDVLTKFYMFHVGYLPPFFYSFLSFALAFGNPAIHLDAP